MKPKIFLLDKPIIRHLAFFYLEIKSSILRNDPTKGNFKFIKRMFVRWLIPYYESLCYYLIKFRTKSIIKKKLNVENLNIAEHGVEFLNDIDISKINFIEYNLQEKDKTVTHNQINFKKAENFARINFFHDKAKDYLKTDKCNFHCASWNTSFHVDKYKVRTSLWHRDRDGIKLCKIFIYLSDVLEGCGEHNYIISSHIHKPFKFTP